MRIRTDQSGQALTEYVLLLFTIVSVYLVVSGFMARYKLTDKLLKPIKSDFLFAYKYGNPKARGFDEGTPVAHPRIVDTEQKNFRIFINPKGNK